MKSAFSGMANYQEGSLEEIIGQLKRLGFTDHEARTYLALCESYPATAYEVSKSARLPRSNVYNVLRTLEKKEAIQLVSQRPARYAPRDPEEFFKQVAKSTLEICENLSEFVKEKTDADEDVYIWTFRNEKTIENKLSELIIGAKSYLWLVTSTEILESFVDEITAAAKRGVQVLIILYGKPPKRLKTDSNILVLPHEGSGRKFTKASEKMFTITADFKEMMLGKFGTDAVGSHSRNAQIIYLILRWVTHEIYLAEIYAKLGKEIENLFGAGLSKLRQKYRPKSGEYFPHGDWELLNLNSPGSPFFDDD